MELNITITPTTDCKVSIHDLSEYLPEDYVGTVKGKFKKSQTVSIDVLQHNKTSEAINKQCVYNYNSSADILIPIDFDGWFTVTHIVLPSKEWFDTELSKQEGSALSLYDIVYYSDGSTSYKYINQQSSEVSIQEILQVNTINTTISRTSSDYVSICFLRKCYIDLCQQIFNKQALSPCQNRNIDSALITKRDIVWMAINVITYLTEQEQLAEVERITEIINSCNGICNQYTALKYENGCGCY